MYVGEFSTGISELQVQRIVRNLVAYVPFNFSTRCCSVSNRRSDEHLCPCLLAQGNRRRRREARRQPPGRQCHFSSGWLQTMFGRRNVRPPGLGLEAAVRRPARTQRTRGLPFNGQPVLYRELSLELPGFEPELVPGFEAAATGNRGGRYWEPGRIPPGMTAEIVGQVGDLTDEFRP